ncbi:MAG: aquaporin [Gemmatimonadetes bacterium]|nr:aquaporin [Gemmatimonadota bacterium]
MTARDGFSRWRRHWPEYLAEAFGLGLFMVSACGFAVLLFAPGSPLVASVPSAVARSALMGLAMGGTLVLNVYSPWGRRSGAHLNPAVTLTFFRLGKVAAADVAGYVAAQFAGGVAGTAVAVLLFRPAVADPAVNYVATLPGPHGLAAAFVAECGIAFGMMLMVLVVTGRERLAPFTGVLAGLLVALYIAVEAPLSGMSMNPARTTGSAVFAHAWTGLWIYFTAPLLGMLAAAELTRRAPALRRDGCAKLHHDRRVRCIFCGHAPR